MRPELRRADVRERAAALLGVLTLLASANACQPDLVVGERLCFSDETGAVRDADGSRVSDIPIAVPWQTGFENGFCDYRDGGGYCHVNTEAGHEIVESPVRSGRFAAAFSVTGNASRDALGARCVMQGALPESAYYGAWYYIPEYRENSQDWNLLHFEGWIGSTQRRLWDVSIESNDGELTLYLWDFIRSMRLPPTRRVSLPIGAWVHVEFFLRRSADADGEIALYQNDEVLFEDDGLVTDDTERVRRQLGDLRPVRPRNNRRRGQRQPHGHLVLPRGESQSLQRQSARDRALDRGGGHHRAHGELERPHAGQRRDRGATRAMSAACVGASAARDGTTRVAGALLSSRSRRVPRRGRRSRAPR